MASLSEIRAMGGILQRRSRGRIWNNDPLVIDKKQDQKRYQKGHFKKHWDKDLWD